MLVTIKSAKGTINRDLVYRKIGNRRYAVVVDEKAIGCVYRADGRIKKFRNHRLVGTQTVDRWFAETTGGVRLGPADPYDEGNATRAEATVELFETFFGVRRDPKSW